MPKKQKQEYKKITTPIFRTSFPHVFKAFAFDDKQEPKFSIQMLFDKETTNLGPMKAEIKRVAEAFFGNKKPRNFRDPILDGDEMENKDGEPIEQTKGHWVVKATSTRKPGIVDKHRNMITEEDDEFYAGCYARATVVASAYDYLGNTGVTFYLNNIQKIKDGERFGGARSAEDDFDDYEGDEDDDNTSDSGW